MSRKKKHNKVQDGIKEKDIRDINYMMIGDYKKLEVNNGDSVDCSPYVIFAEYNKHSSLGFVKSKIQHNPGISPTIDILGQDVTIYLDSSNKAVKTHIGELVYTYNSGSIEYQIELKDVNIKYKLDKWGYLLEKLIKYPCTNNSESDTMRVLNDTLGTETDSLNNRLFNATKHSLDNWLNYHINKSPNKPIKTASITNTFNKIKKGDQQLILISDCSHCNLSEGQHKYIQNPMKSLDDQSVKKNIMQCDNIIIKKDFIIKGKVVQSDNNSTIKVNNLKAYLPHYMLSHNDHQSEVESCNCWDGIYIDAQSMLISFI